MAIGADLAPEVGVGGIQSLKDLADYSKTGDPSATAGLTGDLSTITQKFSDMGAGKLINASAAPAMFANIQNVPSILNNAANPTLKSLMDELTPNIQSMIGSGSGPNGIPTIKDFLGPVCGGGAFDKMIADGAPTPENVAALQAQINSAKSLFSVADIQKAANPATQTLGDAMNFAGSLHKWGKDQSEGGLGQSLREMANGANKYGEALKVSLAEGNNKNVLTANGIGPLKTNPFEGLPSQDPADPAAGARLLGGGSSPPPPPSQGTRVSGSSTQGGSFGSGQIQGQEGTGVAGLRGTPFDVSGGR